jgi:hypothetical protein
LRTEGLGIGLAVSVVLVVLATANSDMACVEGIASDTENVGKTAMDDAGGNTPTVAATIGMLHMYTSAMTLVIGVKLA